VAPAIVALPPELLMVDGPMLCAFETAAPDKTSANV
jgi:hypothetical protein